jgi:hypothetical protein
MATQYHIPIKEIKDFPTQIRDISNELSHESVLRAYQILEYTKTMLERGDSNETILEVIQHLEG